MECLFDNEKELRARVREKKFTAACTNIFDELFQEVSKSNDVVFDDFYMYERKDYY